MKETMNVTRNNASQGSSSLSSLLLEDRNIMLNGPIDDNVSANIVAQLLYLEAKDPGKDIYLYINSPGGVITSGLSIYDTMNYITSDVSTICIGQAASMGAFLLSSGSKGKRYVLPSARIMLHQPSGGAQGQSTDIQIQAKEIGRIKKYLNSILAEQTQKLINKIEKDTERDFFMTAQESVDYGIVDSVLYSNSSIS